MRLRDQEAWCQRALGPHYEFMKKFSYSGKREISMAQFIVPPKKSCLKQFVNNSSDYLRDGKEFFGIISTSNSFRTISEWMVVQIYDCANFERVRNRIRDSERVLLMTHIFVVPDSYMAEFVNEENPNLSIRLLLEIVNVKNQQAEPWTMVSTFREYFHSQPHSVLTYIWRSRKLLLRSTEAWRQAIVLASAPNEIYLPIFKALEQMKYIGTESIRKGFDKLRSATLALVELVDNSAGVSEKSGSSGISGFAVRCADDVSLASDKVPFGFYRTNNHFSKNTGKFSDCNNVLNKSTMHDSNLGASGCAALSSPVRSIEARPFFDSFNLVRETKSVRAAASSEKKSQTLAVERKSYSRHSESLISSDISGKNSHSLRKTVLSEKKKVEDSLLTQDTKSVTSNNSRFDESVKYGQKFSYRGQPNGRGRESASTVQGSEDATNICVTPDGTYSRNRFHKRTNYGKSDHNRDVGPLYDTKRAPWTNRAAQERELQLHQNSMCSRIEGDTRVSNSTAKIHQQKPSNLISTTREYRRCLPHPYAPKSELPSDPRDAAYESDIVYVNFTQYMRIRHQRQKNAPTMRDLRHLPRAAYFLSDEEDDVLCSTSDEMVITPVAKPPIIEHLDFRKTYDATNTLLEEEHSVSIEKSLQLSSNLHESFECLSPLDVQAPDTPSMSPSSDGSSPVAPSAETVCESAATNNAYLDVVLSDLMCPPPVDHLFTPPRDSDSHFSISSVSSVEIPYSVSPSDPYSPLPFDETPLFLAGFHQKRIAFDIRSLSAVILSTLQQSMDNILIIWLTDIDVDVASSISLFPEQCIVCVKTLNFLANPDVMAILSSSGIIYKGLPFVDSGGVGFSLIWVLSFGTNRLFPDSEHFVQSHSELEHLLMDHFATKDKNCTNIIRSSCEVHGLFAVLLKELKGNIIVTNRYTK